MDVSIEDNSSLGESELKTDAGIRNAVDATTNGADDRIETMREDVDVMAIEQLTTSLGSRNLVSVEHANYLVGNSAELRKQLAAKLGSDAR